MSDNTSTRDANNRNNRGTATQSSDPLQVLVMRLRPDPSTLPQPQRNRITWDSNVTENKNQRTSKKCCVFHRKRLFGESSSDDDSSSDEEEAAADAAHDHGAEGGCCGSAAATETMTQDGSSAAAAAAPAKPHKHKRPKCSKAACYCGTRFS